MVLTWNIPVDRNEETIIDMRKLGDAVFPAFGVSKGEYEVVGESVECSPTSLTFEHPMTPVRMVLYDIAMTYDGSKRSVVFRFRFFKIMVIALVFPLFTLITNPSSGALLVSAMMYGVVVVLFGTMCWVQLAIARPHVVASIRRQLEDGPSKQ